VEPIIFLETNLSFSLEVKRKLTVLFCALTSISYLAFQLTSVEVIRCFISRIRQVNPYINAVVADRFDDALKEAAEVDRILDSGSVPDSWSETSAPFLGVPITTKEAISIAGNVQSIAV